MKLISNLSKIEKTLLTSYLLASILLLLYSLTQIDLGLVISRYPALYQIEKAFQYIGYFNRPLATVLFSLLVILFSALYWYVLHFIKRISQKTIWIVIFSVSALLFLSYNAFSYDLFNYVFDAKIVTKYHENPYLHKALDYPTDPMLSFMHWTHRVYPYGPVWLAVTVPISFLGLQLFLPTLYLFKLLMVFSYIGTCYFIGKIVRQISPENERQSIAMFALNPLVLFESLISAHNDIFMLFLMVVSLYLLLRRKTAWSVVLYLLSIGVKYATVFLLPVYFLLLRKKDITEKYWNSMMMLGTGLMFFAVVVVSYRTNFQSWYLLYVLPIVSLITNRKTILYPTLFLSVIALGNYLPYLYTGTWTTETMQNLFWINSIAGGVAIIWFIWAEISFRQPTDRK